MNYVAMVFALSVVAIPLSATAECNGAVCGAFGYQFGETVVSTSDGILSCSDNGVTCWGINRDISPAQYNVQININRNRKIFRLVATEAIESSNSKDKCIERAKSVVRSLSSKYGVTFNQSESEHPYGYTFSWSSEDNNRTSVSVSCELRSYALMETKNYILAIYLENSRYANDSLSEKNQ
jgi:hypothetical protein